MSQGMVADVSEVARRIKRVAPHFDYSDEEVLQQNAKDALDQARLDKFGENVVARAASYFGAHLYYIAASRTAQIKSQENEEQLTPLSTKEKIEYFKSKETSFYLDEYNRMLDSFGLGRGTYRPFGGPSWEYK